MRLLAHLPLKRESGGGFEGCPRAVSLRLKPPLAEPLYNALLRMRVLDEDLFYPLINVIPEYCSSVNSPLVNMRSHLFLLSSTLNSVLIL